MTAGPGPRVAALLELLRPVTTELVVALDDRADDETERAVAGVADVVFRYPYLEPVDRALGWLFSLCSGDWILNLDDDEIPSTALVAALPRLVAATDVTHYWIARRWLTPDAAHFYDEPPWGRESALRLVRNDRLTIGFSDEFHLPLFANGPFRFVDEPLWHADAALRPYEVRREKVLAYERARRGMRVAGLSLNAAFYLPELRPETRTAPVPEPDRSLLARVLSADRATAPSGTNATVRHAGREEIDRLWVGGWRSLAGLHRGRVEPVEHVSRLTAGLQQTVDVRVANESSWTWRGGKAAMPEVRLAARWHGDAGDEDGLALRTPFPADLEPGASQLVPVHVVPPGRAGRYRLEIDLVHEHEQWFGAGFELEVEVAPRRLVALVGGGEALEAELDRILFEPELEPVLVEPGEDLPAEPFGHPHVPGVRDYLFHGLENASRARMFVVLGVRTRRLVQRAARFPSSEPVAPLQYGAEAFLAAVAGCEEMIVVSRDNDAPLTRELWRLAATVRVAHRLGVPITVHERALEGPQGLTDRLLVRSVLRHSTPVSVEGRGTR
jgi:hypothetical protein